MLMFDFLAQKQQVSLAVTQSLLFWRTISVRDSMCSWCVSKENLKVPDVYLFDRLSVVGFLFILIRAIEYKVVVSIIIGKWRGAAPLCLWLAYISNSAYGWGDDNGCSRTISKVRCMFYVISPINCLDFTTTLTLGLKCISDFWHWATLDDWALSVLVLVLGQFSKHPEPSILKFAYWPPKGLLP